MTGAILFVDTCPTVEQRGGVMMVTLETGEQTIKLALPFKTLGILAERARRALVEMQTAQIADLQSAKPVAAQKPTRKPSVPRPRG